MDREPQERASLLIANQKGQFKGLKPQTFFPSVRELSASLTLPDGRLYERGLI